CADVSEFESYMPSHAVRVSLSQEVSRGSVAPRLLKPCSGAAESARAKSKPRFAPQNGHARRRMITVDGDSMDPLLSSGDRILIDTSQRIPVPPGIFVLCAVLSARGPVLLDWPPPVVDPPSQLERE